MRSNVIRRVALGSALALTVGLAGCGGADNSAEGTDVQIDAEVFTWWTAGSEEAGLNALVQVLGKEHPNVRFVNATVAGGAGSNAQQVLDDRLAAFDPPDSFQAHAGAELIDQITNGRIRDISFLYDELGLREAFPPDLLERLTVNDKIYSIPANVHRANVVWVNPKVLESAGIDPDTEFKSTEEWIDALEKIKADGKTPLAIGQNWTQLHLFETILLADLGAEEYSGLWDGTTSWSSANVTKAIENFGKLLSLSNDNRDDLEWPQALALVQDGSAGFNVMGDWAAAELEGQGITLGTDVLVYPVPGTDGVFDFLADSFTLPVGAPHPEGARAWLETVASLEGQVVFNKAKGSIPARIDADPSDFSEYQQGAIADFTSNTIVSSLAHGAAASPAVTGAISEAVVAFSDGDMSVSQFQSALATAAG